MAILKYLGMVLYAARAAQTNTERTPRVPLVSIRELHEDFSGKVEDATCARKPELVNAHCILPEDRSYDGPMWKRARRSGSSILMMKRKPRCNDSTRPEIRLHSTQLE